MAWIGALVCPESAQNEAFHFDVLDGGGAVALLLFEVSVNLCSP